MFSRCKKRRILYNHKVSLPADTNAECYTTLCAMQTSVVDVRRTTLEKAYFRAELERQNHNGTFTYYGSLKIEKLLKIVFLAKIGSSQDADAWKCDFDTFCFTYLRCNAAFAILYCAEAAVPESIVRLYAVVTVTDLVIRPRGR